MQYLIKDWKNVLLITPVEIKRPEEHDASTLAHIITQSGGSVERCHATTKNLGPILAKAQNKNIIIAVRYSLTQEQIGILSAYCSQHTITLYTTDIDMVEHGAAIGSGGGEYEVGVTVGDKIKLIIEGALPVSDIPIGTQIMQPTIMLNHAVMNEQALKASPAELFVIGSGKTVSSVSAQSEL